jgi:hypothetical protein
LASFIGCLIACVLTGYTVDRRSQQQLDAMKHSSIQKLESTLYAGSDNAWYYYEEAIDRATNVQPDQSRKDFVYGRKPMDPYIERTILENHHALELLKTGAAHEHCSVLFGYRGGLFRRNTNLNRLKLITQVLCARGLYRLEKGETRQGMEDIFASLTIAKHIVELSPTILDQIGGVNMLYWGLSVLNTGIASGAFSKNELASINSFLGPLEQEWPQLSFTLERQIAALKIHIASSSVSATANFVLLPHHGKEPSALLRLLVRLRYWRYLFSTRRAFIARFTFLDSLVAEMSEIEEKNAVQGYWNVRETFPLFFDERITEHHRGNPIPAVFTPKLINTGLLFNMTRMRLLHCAAIIAQYRDEKGYYPPDLSGCSRRIATDPNTGNIWQYEIIGDEASLRSSGLDIDEPYDNIVVVLTRKGIVRYLSDRQKQIQNE